MGKKCKKGKIYEKLSIILTDDDYINKALDEIKNGFPYEFMDNGTGLREAWSEPKNPEKHNRAFTPVPIKRWFEKWFGEQFMNYNNDKFLYTLNIWLSVNDELSKHPESWDINKLLVSSTSYESCKSLIEEAKKEYLSIMKYAKDVIDEAVDEYGDVDNDWIKEVYEERNNEIFIFLKKWFGD